MTESHKKVNNWISNLNKFKLFLIEKIKEFIAHLLAISIMLFILVFVVIVPLWMWISNYYDNNEVKFQTPVKFQSPVIFRKRVVANINQNLIFNTPCTPKIATFQKLLTEKGASNREWVLNYVKEKYQCDELIAFDNILKKEAGYRTDAINEIGACGIGQANPCSKMKCGLDDIKCQTDWVISYIENRFLTPSRAWEFHLANNWY